MILVGNQFVWIPCSIDGADGSIKYDRCAFARNGWAYTQTKLNEKDADGSYKIVRADQTSYYYHEQMPEEEKASIEKYGGVYIGRYETGCDVERSESSKGNIDSLGKIKPNLSVYNYILKSEAQQIVERMYNGKSRICSSYAWDTALRFIDGETGTYAVNSDGGNYLGKGGLKNTGYYAIKNIYDMGGNVWEWTTENYNNPTYPWVVRGGYYVYSASDSPAAFRNYTYTVGANVYVGVRATLYI